MKIEYDKEGDSAYIYLRYPIEEGGAKKTIELDENIIIDLDKNHRLIGIEILNAKKLLNKKIISEAQTA